MNTPRRDPSSRLPKGRPTPPRAMPMAAVSQRVEPVESVFAQRLLRLAKASFALAQKVAPWRRGLVVFALAVVSFAMLRLEMAYALRYSFGDAIDQGFLLGALHDGFGVALVAGAATVLWVAAGTPRSLLVAFGLLLVWLMCLSNLIYFRFFGIPLDWWVARLHVTDIVDVRGSATDIGAGKLTWLSGSLLAAALFVAARGPRARLPLALSMRLGVGGWLVGGALLLAFITGAAPSYLGYPSGLKPLDEGVVRAWYRQGAEGSAYVGLPDRPFVEEHARHALTATAALVTYRDFERDDPPDPLSARWPLLYEQATSPAEVVEVRQALGLPTDKPVHVVLLFLESVRAFELQHPRIGEEVFPRLRALLDEHAIHYTQAYVSSYTPGQTVRGQFSTICSMLPNMAGEATYVGHPTVRGECLPNFLKRQGYRTAWFNTYHTTFHNKEIFERLHGTDLFFDGDYFRSRGLTKQIGTWGIADGPFLLESVKMLNELAGDHMPVFVNALTSSTHHPFTVIDEGRLSPALEEELRDSPAYHGYLSRLRYADESIGQFFEALFASPIGDQTLVVVLGDHSTPQLPHFPVTEIQQTEIHFRVPMALVTKNMPLPHRDAKPVHQIDVAPTIARIVGGRGPATWIGRGLLGRAGSPWVYDDGRGLSYRIGGRACYGDHGRRQRQCVRVDFADPMYATELEPVDELPEHARLFGAIPGAVRHAIVNDQLAPPPRELGALGLQRSERPIE